MDSGRSNIDMYGANYLASMVLGGAYFTGNAPIHPWFKVNKPIAIWTKIVKTII